jgi:hypothetical protein
MSRDFKSPESVSKWTQLSGFPPGVEELIIYRDKNSQTYARLVRMPVGFPGAAKLKHDFDEVVYIVQGGIVDTVTKKGYPEGHFAFFPKGLEHGPLASPVGALVIEFRHYTAESKK